MMRLPCLRLGRLEPQPACLGLLKRTLDSDGAAVQIHIADPSRQQFAAPHTGRQRKRADGVEAVPLELVAKRDREGWGNR
jgi:hypothetical protein